RFYSGQGRTTAGEDFQQQPVAYNGGHGHGRSRGNDGDWMPAADDNAENTDHDGSEQRSDKEIGGNGEGNAGIAHPAEIEDGDDDQNANADPDRVWQQGRNGRDQSAHSC